ncbi:FAD binding domain-containing protein [Actinacidiphila sp. ITFR-21]|uniref:FAD binding domain-containing protein n=1 Tax=Actinacidiphila sp. ITFR-21 TaxID=3075199 RepID=UPI00288C1C9B|nr:FAD binding domain-containing protein [Streptomyces sp. ITFR-21]WNI17841.1 FAD binding domain-containing protein [Streptomyces sp. ITFR-21]
MRPVRFAYARPRTAEEAVAELRRHGPLARVVAGGQSLLPLMYQRRERPTALVDLGSVDGLRSLRRDGDALHIGATTTHRAIETATGPDLRGFEVLPEAARQIAHLPVRVRGTFGGSLANADPRAEWCLLATLLGAEITALGPDGVRGVPIGDFLLGDGRTALGWDEILVGVRLPRPAPSAALAEFGWQDGSLPVVAAATEVELAPDGSVTAVRAALSGVADRPVLLAEAERVLVGGGSGEQPLAAAARGLADTLDPPSDAWASGAYRRELAAAVLLRSLRDSVSRATTSALARTTSQEASR